MAKYSADIEIAIRGGRQVDGLIKSLNKLNNSINVVNRNAKLLEGKGFNVASMENYSRAVFKAENALRKAAQGTKQEEMAVKSLVSAMELENKARSRRNFLIAQEVANRRQVIATANAGFGAQGPQAANIRAGRGPASPVRGTATMAGSPAALAAANAGGGVARAGGGITGRLGGAISSGLIGGGFPLLFGQGAGAAAGGALGGIAGGLMGGGFGFGLSIIGTLLGDIASRGQAVKQLGQDLGFSAQQAQTLASAFKTANTDVQTFTAVVQNIRGLGLELQDQAELIKLTTALTEKYGGQFDKVGNAITSALESGKVSQATLNQLTSQGINVQQALADKLGVSRDKLLEMAKKGKIGIQDLVDVLVDMGNKGVSATRKPASGMEQLAKAASGLGSALSALGGAIMKALAPPLNWLSKQLAFIINLAAQGISAMANLLSGGTAATAAANARARQRLAAEGGPSAGSRYVPAKYQQRLSQLEKEEQANAASAAAKVNKINVSSLGQAAPSGGGRGRKPKDLTEQRQQQLEAAARMAVEAEFELRAQVAITDQEKLQNDYDKARLERMTKYETLYRKALSNAEIEYLLTAQRSETLKAAIAYEQEKAVLLKKEVEDMYRLLDVAELLDEVTQRRLGRAFGMTGGAFRTDINLDPNNQGIKQLDIYNAELQILTERLTLAKNGAEAIGDAFSNSFQGIVNGTQTTQQALQQFFQQVGQAFNAMAAEIIAKMITMYVFKSVLGIFGGGGGSLFSGAGPVSGAQAFSTAGPSFNPAAFNGTAIMPFAEGGFVTGPTRAVVGEGGEPEYVIPASKMRSAMNRYASGARGSAVIPTGSDGGDGMATTSAPTGAIDVRYTVERINSVDYVTADQFQRGMQQAAAQGAAQGEQRTLRRLQSSTSTRKRLGM